MKEELRLVKIEEETLQDVLWRRAVDPEHPIHREYFISHPERLNRLQNPKSIADVVPQATDAEHPLHEEFWQMFVSGGIFLTDQELEELLNCSD